MKEYGGYLEFEHFSGDEYHKEAFRLNTARNALRFIIREKKIKKIYLPDYICPVIIDACQRENVEIFYYPIKMDFKPDDTNVPPDEYFYFINYYGQFDNEEIKEIHEKHPHMIVDNVQAFFQRPIKTVDTIYTCRKFLGVSDGAYLYTDVAYQSYDKLCQDSSLDRLEHLVGRLEYDASTFFVKSSEMEKTFDNLDGLKMSKFTQNILCGFDYRRICDIRTRNWQKLHEKLKGINLLNINVVEGGYMYPLMVKNASDIRKNLIKKSVYIPKLWPNEKLNQKRSPDAYKLTNDVLPLPIDQRYSENDMSYISDLILSCILI